MLVRELQPDMSMAFKAVANWNARYPISVRPEGSAIVCKVLQYRKASAAIAVSDDGKMTCPFASGVMAQPPRTPGTRSASCSSSSSSRGSGGDDWIEAEPREAGRRFATPTTIHPGVAVRSFFVCFRAREASCCATSNSPCHSARATSNAPPRPQHPTGHPAPSGEGNDHEIRDEVL